MIKACEKCGGNEFSVTDEVFHVAEFNELGELVIGSETDNEITEITCSKCGHPVDPNEVDVIW